MKSARQSGESIQCYSGEQRARIYILSYMTGLRRGEMAGLTPQSFALEADPPTVTVQATVSKHRRKDVLPLHPDLVAMLREWTDGLGPEEPLFPKLARRRTWLMVKKDLERAGIPYQTAEGIADFHAAGRHAHITELLRNGATLAEAKELARHSDVKMTMRYTHIGIEDQAKALAALPAPCQEIVRKPAVSGRREASAGDSDRQDKAAGKNDASPCEVSSSDGNQQKKAPSDIDGALWRRRELNPRPVSPELEPLRA